VTKDLKTLLEELLPNNTPTYDMCSCSNCGAEFEIANLEWVWDSDGWEYPSYKVTICPVCPDGGMIDDYWASDEWPNKLDQD
jgi:hypothetical protein